ncbi:MAG TPA: PAC2 family protein [Rubrobacteraceae bacterium]|nr:PAC2 family protein [Rubrobacteraceae bacterium]
MENRYLRLEWRPELERPVLIAAFTGWNDAADAASVALGALASSWEVRRFGSFDGEEFFDYGTTRPQIKLTDGVTRTIEWPENVVSATAPRVEAAGGRGVVLLSGPEPNFRWRSFSGAVAELAKKLGVELVVTMGALLADVPHSRPVAVSANSQDPALVESLGLSASRYEGPTGITGVLHRACAEAGLPSVSFWASVPHYLPAVPSAPAALALLDGLSTLLGVAVDTSDLEQTAATYQEQVSVAVSRDEDLASYVRMLEERFDSYADQESRDLPSGDELALELESFLRQQRREEES